MTKKVFNATIKPETLDHLLRILLDCDCQDHLMWDSEEANQDKLVFSICANDLFSWGCADTVEITDDNVGVFEESVAELEAIGGRWMVTILAPELFCCRVRSCKPQRPWFPSRRAYLLGFGGESNLEFTEGQVDSAMQLFEVEGWEQYA